MGPVRRRQLLGGSAVQQGTGVNAYTVGFRTDPATLVADLLEIPVNQVLKRKLTREQACMDLGPMRSTVRLQLENAFKASAENVLSVQIVYVVVNMNGEDCAGVVQRRASAETQAEATFDVLVAFGQPDMAINKATLLTHEWMVNVEIDEAPDQEIRFDETVQVAEGAYDDPTEEDAEPLSSAVIYIIVGVVAGLVALLLLFGGIYYYQRGRCAKLRDEEAEIVTVMYLRDVKSDLRDDMFGEGGQEDVDEKMHVRQMHNEFEDLGNQRRRSDDFENAFSSPSKESRGDIF